MENRCDGKTSCSVQASNSIFTDPCIGTFKYLNISYSCINTSEYKHTHTHTHTHKHTHMHTHLNVSTAVFCLDVKTPRGIRLRN
ncbi:hypothetical protein AALO_G00035270 [Alosa alosa]|uniref:SUEL-type lectin domain-containing protein n=2 Tax=Alosa alosa TaxID=278164 RepID=A0AAV6H689_9TELE|nr:hypothetical protein AALO_G00035270 [Alosa alosa]